MSKSIVKKIVVCIIAITLIVVVATKTFATGDIMSEIDQMRKNKAGNNAIPEGNVQDIQEGKEDKALALNTNEAKDKDKNQAPTTTPYTGAGDYSTLVLIVVFGVAAVYEYKKIKDYNG